MTLHDVAFMLWMAFGATAIVFFLMCTIWIWRR